MEKTFFDNDHCYFATDLNTFRTLTADQVLTELFNNQSKEFDATKEQHDAWLEEIDNLHASLDKFDKNSIIIFEYKIALTGKRIDVVLLVNKIVLSLEYKTKKGNKGIDAQKQAASYGYELKNFHKESFNLYVCPVLISNKIESSPNSEVRFSSRKLADLLEINESDLGRLLSALTSDGSSDMNTPKFPDPEKWLDSPYEASPTTIESAKALILNSKSKDFNYAYSDPESLRETQDKVNEIIQYSRENKRHSLIFLTGVPGAGKTLVGLQTAAYNSNHDTKAIYVTGNYSLYKVLKKSLTKDAKKAEVKEEDLNAILSLMPNFRLSHSNPGQVPPDVLVFDEAQRVWDKDALAKWYKKKKTPEGVFQGCTEAEGILRVMEGHGSQWGVILCLVGNDQDINKGENGLGSWIEAIKKTEKWDVYYSNELPDPVAKEELRKTGKEEHSLHLKVSLRSKHALVLPNFVHHLLSNEPEEATSDLEAMGNDFKLFATRSLRLARRWARANNIEDEEERCGLLMSSKASRLVPEGITRIPSEGLSGTRVDSWFTSPGKMPVSSDFLEAAGTEFDVQGLELDWTIVCWDLDLSRTGDDWEVKSFNARTGSWRKVAKPDEIRYDVNSYRVLLTRARKGMVIFVPAGDDDDPTRDPKEYSKIFDYLKSCGIKELTEKDFEETTIKL